MISVWQYDDKRLYLLCRVVDIMRRDAEKDPAIYPDALRAKQLISQVFTELFAFWLKWYSLMHMLFKLCLRLRYCDYLNLNCHEIESLDVKCRRKSQSSSLKAGFTINFYSNYRTVLKKTILQNLSSPKLSLRLVIYDNNGSFANHGRIGCLGVLIAIFPDGYVLVSCHWELILMAAHHTGG